MTKKYDALIPLIGSWSELLGDLFYSTELTKFSEDLKTMTLLPFEEVIGDRDYFKVFRETPLDKLNLVYIKPLNDSPFQQLKEIELDIFGLSFEVMEQEDFSWWSEQGILFLPQQFTWGENSEFHKKWLSFTTEVLRRIVSSRTICVCTKSTDLIKMIDKANPKTQLVDQGPGCWKKIKTIVNQTNDIQWLPILKYKL